VEKIIRGTGLSQQLGNVRDPSTCNVGGSRIYGAMLHFLLLVLCALACTHLTLTRRTFFSFVSTTAFPSSLFFGGYLRSIGQAVGAVTECMVSDTDDSIGQAAGGR
jgi:hypothetical protein